jgi:hypothetical protein
MTTPAALDILHATEELRTILGFVIDHPGSIRQNVFAAVAPTDEAKQQAAATSVNWLIERGHLIEYYNGVLSMPAENPAFRYLPGERPGGARGESGPRRDEPKRHPTPRPQAPAAKAAQAPVVKEKTPSIEAAILDAPVADTAAPESASAGEPTADE